MSGTDSLAGQTKCKPWPLPCERKHRHLVTSRNASIAPLTLAFSVVAYQLLSAGCKAFAACSPPAGTGMACRNDLGTVMVEALADGRDDRAGAAAWVICG
jgi:hypothetical protein